MTPIRQGAVYKNSRARLHNMDIIGGNGFGPKIKDLPSWGVESNLTTVFLEFQSDGWPLQMIKDNQTEVACTYFTNVHPSEYFYTYRHTQSRLGQMFKA